jgi:hypothetical protein
VAKKLTLRFPPVAAERLQRVEEKYGVTRRGWFESATALSLELEGHPSTHDLALAMWASARRLEASPEFRAQPQKRIDVEFEDDLAAALREASVRHRCSVNAALALTVMVNPAEDPAIGAYYERLHGETLRRARALDASRRRRRGFFRSGGVLFP